MPVLNRRQVAAGAENAATSIVVAAQFLMLLALPSVGGLGIWYQTEPVVVGLLACGAAVAACLGLAAALRGRSRTVPPLTAVVLAALAAILALCASVARLPLTALVGGPELWEAPPQILAVAVLATATALAARRRQARLVLAAGAVAGCVAVTALMLSGNTAAMPYYFPDFLAFHGLFAWAAAMAVLRRAAVKAVATAALVAVLVVAENRAGLLAMPAMAAAWLAWRLGACRARRVASAVAPVVLVGFTVAVAMVRPGLWDPQSMSRPIFDTVASRGLMIKVVADDLMERPLGLAVGNGAGHYRFLLARHLRQEGAHVHALGREGEVFFWDSSRRADFHSHNALAEALATGGLPAAAAILALLAALPGAAPRRHRGVALATAVGFAVLAALWFQMPTSLPAMAVALGLLAGPWRRRRPSLPHAAWTVAAAPTALALGAAGLLMISVAQGARDEIAVNVGARPPASPACRDPLGPAGRFHLVAVLEEQRERLDGALNDGIRGPGLAAAAERLADLMCVADRLGGQRGGELLSVLALVIRSDLAFRAPFPAEAAPALDPLMQGWPAAVAQVLAHSPKRSDLALPFLSWHLAHGDETVTGQWARRLVALSPEDPVGLWFLGAVLLGRPDGAGEGMRLMRLALERDIESVMPVDDRLKAQLRR